MYPSNLMVIEVYSSAPPFSVFSASGLIFCFGQVFAVQILISSNSCVDVQADGSLDVFVVLKNGSLAPAFSLSGTVTATGTVRVRLSMTVAESFAGDHFQFTVDRRSDFREWQFFAVQIRDWTLRCHAV